MGNSGGGLSQRFEELKTKLSGSFFGKSTTSVGVDLGESSIKIVELEQKNGSFLLKNYTIVHSKKNLIKLGTSGVLSEFAGRIVKSALDEAGISARKVNIAVPSFSSLIATIEIPKMPEDEIEKVIQTEAPKYIPVRLDEVVYGWQLIDRVVPEISDNREDGNKKIVKNKKNIATKNHVLIVAIMKEISDRYDAVFSSVGLSIDSLEVDSFSLVRSLIGDDRGAYFVVDIGQKVCNIIVVSNNNILLNRTIDVAGDKITKVISKALSVSHERAEKLKIEQGVNVGGEGADMIAQVLNIMIGEIKRTFVALSEKYPKVNIQKIILSGGGSRLRGLKELITKEIGTETIIGDSFSNVSYPDQISETIKRYNPSLSVAIGLAMLGFEGKK